RLSYLASRTSFGWKQTCHTNIDTGTLSADTEAAGPGRKLS
ncbi:unnamed protein product, partial [marine sediment metagenome]